MRLGWRVKAILETLLLSGVESLELLSSLRKSGGFYASYDSDSDARRQLLQMERSGLIEIQRRDEKTDWIVSLTADGKDVVSDEIDPEDAWKEEWNGKWTSITFDIPAREREKRRALDLWLRKRRFGHMQGSVWVSHRSHSGILGELTKRKVNLSWVAIMVGEIVSNQSAIELAESMWDFDKINALYRDYLDHLSNPAPHDETGSGNKHWHLAESRLWRTAFEADPFLPNALIPPDYLGKEAWQKRKALFQTQQMLTPTAGT